MFTLSKDGHKVQIVPSSRGSPGHKTKKVPSQEPPVLPGSGEMEHSKAFAFPWKWRNVRTDLCSKSMPKIRYVLSLLVAACLCHRRCWRFDEAGESQSAQVRGTPGMELTGGVSVPPASLLSFSSSLCLWAPSLCSRPLECCTQFGLAAAPDPASQAGDLTH